MIYYLKFFPATKEEFRLKTKPNSREWVNRCILELKREGSIIYSGGQWVPTHAGNRRYWKYHGLDV